MIFEDRPKVGDERVFMINGVFWETTWYRTDSELKEVRVRCQPVRLGQAYRDYITDGKRVSYGYAVSDKPQWPDGSLHVVKLIEKVERLRLWLIDGCEIHE